VAKPAGPKRTSRAAPVPAPAAVEDKPKPAAGGQTRRVKKKKGGARR
jgi:hypothetical protein